MIVHLIYRSDGNIEEKYKAIDYYLDNYNINSTANTQYYFQLVCFMFANFQKNNHLDFIKRIAHIYKDIIAYDNNYNILQYIIRYNDKFQINIDVIKILIEEEIIDLTHLDIHGNTSLELAKLYKRGEIYDYLYKIEHKDDWNGLLLWGGISFIGILGLYMIYSDRD